MDPVLKIIGRESDMLTEDILYREKEISSIVKSSSFLVIGGAGSIGQAVTREIFRRNPKLLHVVDISENNLVELVRDLRSSQGYTDGEFATFAIDVGSELFDSFIRNGNGYDFVLNLSALKHVRSEKDPYTLMRLIEVNVLNTDRSMQQVLAKGAKKYFCVSTDKAANPVNMMGASKRIMEMFLMRRSLELEVSTARFANVAFSDGSLLFGFRRRMEKEQPLAAPNDVRRYFVTPQESGELCLLSCLFGANRDVFFPKLDTGLHLITFSQIAERFLAQQGYEPYLCSSEQEARELVPELKQKRQWPVFFFPSDTTGEKDFEEFYTNTETLDMSSFKNLGVIKNHPAFDPTRLSFFEDRIRSLRTAGRWSRKDLIDLFNFMIPEFDHKETGKFLEGRM